MIPSSRESFYRLDSRTISWTQMLWNWGVSGSTVRGEMCLLPWVGGARGWCLWWGFGGRLHWESKSESGNQESVELGKSLPKRGSCRYKFRGYWPEVAYLERIHIQSDKIEHGGRNNRTSEQRGKQSFLRQATEPGPLYNGGLLQDVNKGLYIFFSPKT